MKKIGIDARLYSQTGVGVYIRNLLHYLSLENQLNLQFYVYCMVDDTARISLRSDMFTLRPVPYKWHSFGEQIGFYHALMRDNIDLMHFTYFSYPILYGRPFISTIHDVILLEHKTGKASVHSLPYYEMKHRVFRHVFSKQVDKSLTIITPTNIVKDQLIDTFGAKYGNKIKTIYEGLDYELMEAKVNTNLKKLYKKPFFLYVGNFYPHKNVEQLIRAFSSISDAYDLVLVGPDDYFSHNIAGLVKKQSLEQRVHMVHNIPKEDLAFYYTNAESLIHPSLSEGFGLPLIEAAHFGLPVIASDIPVFRELLGKTFMRFDPLDPSAIVKAVQKHIDKPTKPDYTSIMKKYSFKHMSAEIAKLYEAFT